jgi:molecular chaperone GrpE
MTDQAEKTNELTAEEQTPSTEAQPEETEPAVDLAAEIEQLQEELEKAQAQADDYLDGWRRSQAEFSNYRKRQENERQRLIEMGNAGLIAKILPVIDDLERAMQTLPQGLQQLTWIGGVFLIARKLQIVLETEGVTPIETEGQDFSPLYHEAITYEEAAGFEDGQIIAEVQRGYMMADRVIRPALVRVASAPSVPAEEPEPEEAQETTETGNENSQLDTDAHE